MLEAFQDDLSDDEEQAREQIDEAFERLEARHPALAAYIAGFLARPMDESAQALGYFLCVAVWQAFERAHGDQLDTVGTHEVNAAHELVHLDESLRQADPAEALETEDVIGLEQPALVEYVNTHIDAALETHAADIDVDDVDVMYHLALEVILALSYAVRRPVGYPPAKHELLA